MVWRTSKDWNRPARSQIRIFDRRRERVIPAVLISNVSTEAIQETEQVWQRYRAAALEHDAQSATLLPESARWDWRRKRAEVKEQEGRVCAVLADGEIQ